MTEELPQQFIINRRAPAPMQPDPSSQTVLTAILSITTTINSMQKDLAINTNETKNIVDRLDRLNGSVAKHDTQISLNTQAISLVTQTLQTLHEINNRKTDSDGDWKKWMIRALIVLGAYILYNILIRIHLIQPLIH